MDEFISRAMLRDPVRWELDRLATFVKSRVFLISEKGAQGRIHKDAAPGYMVGLKGYLALLDRVAPVPKAETGERAPAVINIAIITSEHHAPGAPETNGRAIRIVSSEGDGA